MDDPSGLEHDVAGLQKALDRANAAIEKEVAANDALQEKFLELAVLLDEIVARHGRWEKTTPPWGFSWRRQFFEVKELVDSLVDEAPNIHTMRKEFDELLRAMRDARNTESYSIRRTYRTERRLHTREATLTEPLLKRAARWKYAAKKYYRATVAPPTDQACERCKKAAEILYPIRYKHWDMKACDCEVCEAHRLLSSRSATTEENNE